MNGTASSSSNHSATASSRTEGAKGRNDSRRLIFAEDRLHVGTPGIAYDGTIAECARTPFHAALEPSYDFAVGNRGGSATAELCLLDKVFDRAARRHHLRAPRRKQRCDLVRAEVGAPIRVIHDKA